MTQKLIIGGIIAFAILGALFFIEDFKHAPAITASEDTTSNDTNILPRFIENIIEEKPTSAQFIFVGDIMLGRGVATSVKKNMNDDFNELFKNVPELKQADVAFGNLEGPISERGRNVGSKYSFRFEPRTKDALKNAGFDVLSTANNHSGDWTIDAFTDTLTYLQGVGILTPGGGMNKQEAIEPQIIEKNGVRYGFLGFSDVGPNWLEASKTTAGILLASDPGYETIIKNAKAKVDILLVSIHWGDEYKPHNARQTKLGRSAIDNGATIVIGHHPHVEEAVEEYNQGLIIYSLGNFIFDQYFSAETMQGLVVEAELNKDGLISYNKKHVTLSRQYQPIRIE